MGKTRRSAREDARAKVNKKISVSIQKSNEFGKRPSDIDLLEAVKDFGAIRPREVYSAHRLSLITGRKKKFLEQWIRNELKSVHLGEDCYLVLGSHIIDWVERQARRLDRDAESVEERRERIEASKGTGRTPKNISPQVISDELSYNSNELAEILGFANGHRLQDWIRKHKIPYLSVKGVWWVDGSHLRKLIRAGKLPA